MFVCNPDCRKHSEKTSFENGAIDSTEYECTIDMSGIKHENLKGLLSLIKDFFGVDDDVMLPNSCGEVGRLDVQRHENNLGNQPNERELEMWKDGLIDLQFVIYTIYIEETVSEKVDLLNPGGSILDDVTENQSLFQACELVMNHLNGCDVGGAKSATRAYVYQFVNPVLIKVLEYALNHLEFCKTKKWDEESQKDLEYIQRSYKAWNGDVKNG